MWSMLVLFACLSQLTQSNALVLGIGRRSSTLPRAHRLSHSPSNPHPHHKLSTKLYGGIESNQPLSDSHTYTNRDPLNPLSSSPYNPPSTTSTLSTSNELSQPKIPKPSTVEINANVVGPSILVSGFLQTKSTSSDQSVFNFLKQNSDNVKTTGLKLNRIIAYCENSIIAKKRLIGRSARYSGLLDLLEFKEQVSSGFTSTVPAVDVLDGVDAWIAFGVKPGEISEIADVAMKSKSLKNLVVVIALNDDQDASPPPSTESTELIKSSYYALSQSAVSGSGSGSGLTFTFITTGSIVDGPEGTVPYIIGDGFSPDEVNTLKTSNVNRDEVIRIMTECLSLKSANGRCVSLRSADVGGDEGGYLKQMREQGYTRMQEIAFNLEGGAGKHQAAIEAWKKKVLFDKENKSSSFNNNSDEQTAEMRFLVNKKTAELEEKRIDLTARKWLTNEYGRITLGIYKYWMDNGQPADLGVFIELYMKKGRIMAMQQLKQAKVSKSDEERHTPVDPDAIYDEFEEEDNPRFWEPWFPLQEFDSFNGDEAGLEQMKREVYERNTKGGGFGASV